MSPSSVFNAIDYGATVITATRRLSRELIRQFDQARFQSGDHAWPSADVLPWDAWIRRCWNDIAPLVQNQPLVLTEGQLEVMWSQIVTTDIGRTESSNLPLWNTRATARAAIRTLRLVRDWQIDNEQLKKSAHPDHRCFVRWLKAYEAECRDKNWIDRSQIADLLLQNIKILNPRNIHLIGFDRLLPKQQALVHALKQKGIPLQIRSHSAMDNSFIKRFEFTDELSQWMAAGNWAREKLEHNPNCKTAIVAPDLAKSMVNIEYALRQTLCPLDLVEVEDSSRLPFHLSLGTSLSKQPVITSAINLLLAANCRNVAIDQISDLILSPHVHGASEELAARSTLDIELRKRLATKSSIIQVLEYLDYQLAKHKRDQCPKLRSVLSNCIRLVNQSPPKDSFNAWSKLFDKLLQNFGWPAGVYLDSDSFQGVRAFREQLHRFGELDLNSPSVSLDSALAWFHQRLDNKIFQAEASETQVEVMGVIEMAGLEFDYLWFGGLVETDWPPRLNIDPFIPVSVQREAGIEQASASDNLSYAEAQQHRLFASAREIICSHHLFESEIMMEPSSLLNMKMPETFSQVEIPQTIDQRLNQQRSALSFVEDTRGPALSIGRAIDGGSGLIQAQSLCPRGAFARFRLGAETLHDNEPGLDTLERGSLVHKVLEMTWQSLGTSSELHSISLDQLEELISQCSMRALRRFQPGSGCGDQYFLSVKRWLVATLLEWFSIERYRNQPFEILSVEQKSQLNLAGLPLCFKIDRIDRLDDGSLILIDYKTGSRNSVNNWTSERPQAPQLPLYALSQESPIEAVTWAQVRLGQCQFIGLSNRHEFGVEGAGEIGVKKLEQHKVIAEHFSDWNGLLSFWNQALGSIATEFINGDARRDPANLGVCTHCPTPVICRNSDRAGVEVEI
ncbi:MAG: PD-(D/E)XK nuclease family protein [Arenicellales bacterium]